MTETNPQVYTVMQARNYFMPIINAIGIIARPNKAIVDEFESRLTAEGINIYRFKRDGPHLPGIDYRFSTHDPRVIAATALIAAKAIEVQGHIAIIDPEPYPLRGNHDMFSALAH